VIYNLDAAVFTLLGSFITSCFTNNWLWQDLLRKPLYFNGSLQQSKLLVFNLPLWLPYNDCILLTNGTGIESKLKDLFLPAQVQKQSDTHQFVILNVEHIASLTVATANMELVYWPGYRFVIEPMSYGKENTPARYMLKAIDYMLRVAGQEVELDEARQSLRTPQLKIQVNGNQSLDSVELTGFNEYSFWSLSERVIRLEGERFEIFRRAFDEMLSKKSRLENCAIQAFPTGVELRYVG